MASRHKTAQTMLAALLLVMSCMVFLAPGLQSASAESSATVIDDVEPAIEDETIEEPVEETEPAEEFIPVEPQVPLADPEPADAASGDMMGKDHPPMPHGPCHGKVMEKEHPPMKKDRSEPITDDDLLPSDVPERQDRPGAAAEKPSMKPSEKPDSEESNGIIAFGDFIGMAEGEEPSEKPSMKPSEKPDFHTEPMSISDKPVVSVKVDMSLLQAMIYEMIAGVGELTDDSDLLDRDEEDDGSEDAEDCIIYVTDESEEAEPAPVPETVIPGEFYTPPQSDSLADALRAEQVVSQLA